MRADLESKAEAYRTSLAAQVPSRYLLPSTPLPLDVSDLPRTSGLLTSRQLEIVSLDATSLAKAIDERRFTSLEVTEAFIASISIAQQATCCLSWFAPDEARIRAKSLDEEHERTGKTVGALHGVPISAKDSVQINGYKMTLGGFAVSAGHVPDHSSQIIEILQDAGAVFIAKTAMVQSIMQLETVSFLGVTTCPSNRDLSAGGSSGGEGALLGMRGSVLGIGTDIGGSIRSPAANNGLWGFKPTTTRLPREDTLGATSTSLRIGAIGPLAHSVRDLELFIKIILDAQPWQQNVHLVPLPWRSVDQHEQGLGSDGWKGKGGKLRVGVMWQDGVVRPLRPIRRALDGVVGRLRGRGIEVVDFEMKNQAEGWDLIKQMYYIDGGKRLRDAFDGEPMLPLTEWIVSQAKPLNGEKVQDLVEQSQAFQQDFHDHFRRHNIDVLLCPAAPYPAAPHSTTKYWPYTSVFNLLDWPAAVFPTGLRAGAAEVEEAYEPRNEQEKDVYDHYDPKSFDNAPLGLQLVAPKWEDERLMAALRSSKISSLGLGHAPSAPPKSSHGRREVSGGAYTMFTPQQVKQFKEAFTMIDQDGDGRVTEGDLKIMLSNLGQTPSPSLLNALLSSRPGSSVSTDRSQGINFTQFLSMMGEHLLELDPEPELLEAFACFDEGDKGVVSVSEIRKCLAELGDRMSDAEIDRLFSGPYTDRQGRFSYVDFAKVLRVNDGGEEREDRLAV